MCQRSVWEDGHIIKSMGLQERRVRLMPNPPEEAHSLLKTTRKSVKEGGCEICAYENTKNRENSQWETARINWRQRNHQTFLRTLSHSSHRPHALFVRLMLLGTNKASALALLWFAASFSSPQALVLSIARQSCVRFTKRLRCAIWPNRICSMHAMRLDMFSR